MKLLESSCVKGVRRSVRCSVWPFCFRGCPVAKWSLESEAVVTLLYCTEQRHLLQNGKMGTIEVVVMLQTILYRTQLTGLFTEGRQVRLLVAILILYLCFM